jgi:uncharacterized membrane protein
MQKPVHPILVHFPIALLVTSFIADAAYWITSFSTLRHAGFWMLVAASLTGALTVAAGMFDMRRAALDGPVHERVHRHMWVGIVLYAVICALTLWRWSFFAPDMRITVLYLDFALLAVALAAFQGWLGGELVYTHGVFVAKKQATAGSPTPVVDGAAAQHHSH